MRYCPLTDMQGFMSSSRKDRISPLHLFQESVGLRENNVEVIALAHFNLFLAASEEPQKLQFMLGMFKDSMLTITAAARPLCVIISGSRDVATRFTIAVASWRRSVIGTIFGIFAIGDTSYTTSKDSTNDNK